MTKRRATNRNIHSEPMYGWALDGRGRPIPIGAAKRGAGGYFCPICGKEMVARKGEIKQYHFAHAELSHCTPEAVATAIGGKWLVLALAEAVVLQRSVTVSWEISGEVYDTNLLTEVEIIAENLDTDHGKADIALLRADHSLRAVITFDQIEESTLLPFLGAGIPVILLPVNAFRSGKMGLEELLATAEVRGGWHLIGTAEGENKASIITDSKRIHDILKHTVDHPPYRFWGALEDQPPHQHILRVVEHRLWLPIEVWRNTIGGSLNRISGGLDVIIQQWEPEEDGSVTVLFYVSLRNTSAVAIRRFPSKEKVHASLTAIYQLRRTTAAEIAQLLANS